jgi:hypothetical protein
LYNSKAVAAEKLSGIVEADETYFLKSEKGNKHLQRKLRKRGSKAKKRGLSKEQECLLVCRDRQTNTINHIFESNTVICWLGSRNWGLYCLFWKQKKKSKYNRR